MVQNELDWPERSLGQTVSEERTQTGRISSWKKWKRQIDDAELTYCETAMDLLCESQDFLRYEPDAETLFEKPQSFREGFLDYHVFLGEDADHRGISDKSLTGKEKMWNSKILFVGAVAFCSIQFAGSTTQAHGRHYHGGWAYVTVHSSKLVFERIEGFAMSRA